MIVVMRPDATEAQVDHVRELVREMGLKDHPIVGTDLTVVAVIGDDRKKDGTKLERAPSVDRVMKVLAPYKMAARHEHKQTTQITVGQAESPNAVVFGGVHVPVIAGPCSVEGEAEILAAAEAVKAAGCHLLRGGAFKPRTNPYAFQGHGEDGLKMLAAARDATGLPVVTEVLTPTDVELVSRYADCLQIGTRNSQNFKLLEAAGSQPKPVLMKRGMAMTLDEYLQAAEYILAAGNPNVILCERGIRTFEDHTRNTLSLSAVPELHTKTHLPVVIDPSHGTGKAHLVPAMAKAAVAAGCDGLAIEVHVDPEHAMTDGAQSITPAVMHELMGQLTRIAAAVDRSCEPHPDAAEVLA
ncbi:MAG: 3-deoxy-7-phosphoheptulonate synthase [Planctomycetota bacterium]